MSILFSYPKSCTKPVKLSIQGLQENKAYLDELLEIWFIEKFCITVRFLKFLVISQVFWIYSTSSMLCLFLDQNKDCRPEDGSPAS
jgi:hypothetical protein